MSEFINNTEHRQKQLKELIMKLHGGAPVEEIKEEFSKKFKNVSGSEIAAMENQLIKDGMPVENIQLLCDVHASVFKGSVEKLHSDELTGGDAYEDTDDEGYPLSHPISVLKRENRLLESWIEDDFNPALEVFLTDPSRENAEILYAVTDKMLSIDKHYARKEYLIFPVMERNDITAPPQVMWGVDDEIRGMLKSLKALLKEEEKDAEKIKETALEAMDQIKEMILKEEEIMLPMIAEVFTEKDWSLVSEGSPEFGYLLDGEVGIYRLKQEDGKKLEDTYEAVSDGEKVRFDAGAMTPEEINAVLNTVPLDMTFVGADDKVKYFTQGKERIFDRPLSIIGREVRHCHPPKSVHIVEQIVEDLRSGKKDHEDFWIQMGNKFVYIRYYAVRNTDGEYLGVLEVTQDIKPLRDLEGEKRLMS